MDFRKANTKDAPSAAETGIWAHTDPADTLRAMDGLAREAAHTAGSRVPADGPNRAGPNATNQASPPAVTLTEKPAWGSPAHGWNRTAARTVRTPPSPSRPPWPAPKAPHDGTAAVLRAQPPARDAAHTRSACKNATPRAHASNIVGIEPDRPSNTSRVNRRSDLF